MTLTDITAGIETIPLKTPFVTALRRVENVETVRVTLTTASGETGIGEAPPTKAITGEDSSSIIETVKSLSPVLINVEFNSIDEAITLLHSAIDGHNSAKAAIDMALYDLLSKEAGLPLYAYLEGTMQPITSDVTISLNGPDQMANDAAEAVANGYNILKVKVGGGDGLDIERTHAVSKAAGKDAILLIDANQAWDEAETFSFLQGTDALDLALIEQPVPATSLEVMRRITKKSSVPILADESVFTIEDAKKVVETGAAHMINIKLMKCGGIYKAKEILDYCREQSVKCMMGSMLEGPVSIAAAMHLCMAYSDTIIWYDLDSPLLYKSLPEAAPMRCEGNVLTLPNRVGI
ncbi:MAG: dipeptide epimerase [Sulfurimonadaceae bacterium]|nr:dipeptide epimerase [Sulfurimonadaceae bacterium]